MNLIKTEDQHLDQHTLEAEEDHLIEVIEVEEEVDR